MAQRALERRNLGTASQVSDVFVTACLCFLWAAGAWRTMGRGTHRYLLFMIQSCCYQQIQVY